MDPRDHHTRLVGDYFLGPRIGYGSFSVVWRSHHRNSGAVVAVKEIDKLLLSPKVNDNLVSEISILSSIDHPNIIRLFEVFECADRIFLVLEYCEGGDLAAYIRNHGKLSEAMARHFMTQLAHGLQVLQEKHIIHRDLKPHNLLLSGSDGTLLLKIGDFGFARSLISQEWADTVCGSPLYMAPEIIRNHKYDAKADLWSVGAILFQLVTGKPPFNGNSQFELFQNILASTELQFPLDALQKLHPDCIELCTSLLRQNPVERLTFKEFFNHKFLQSYSPVHDDIILQGGDCSNRFNNKTDDASIPSTACDMMGRPISTDICFSDHIKVTHSMESIDTEYVIVDAGNASKELVACVVDDSENEGAVEEQAGCSVWLIV